ncbi:oligogalacturonate lyase family protein [Paenibacillus sp. FSL H8-0034]|uniref:oligogalacturonate lyase family protein n=1 Tax=Paenibacillus sp. FSL H8-0034 TaxID=2954671 RepID=UPI0030F80CA7
MEPVRITQGQSNDQLLYFTSSSLTEDDQSLVFISDRDGYPNLFVQQLDTGEVRQLTSIRSGYLKQYVYFDGVEGRGLGKASISLDPARGIVYYIEGDEIRCVDLAGQSRVLNRLPEGQVTAFTHVSADGTRLCVPTTDERALEYATLKNGRPDYDIDARVRNEGLSSYLRVYDSTTGEQLSAERVEGAWITHVQFSPVNRNLILYNHEWPSDCGIRRIWLWDGERHIRVREEAPGRSRGDWTCHEMWEKDGESVIYHGSYRDGGSNYIGKYRLDDGRVWEIALPAGYTKYGHFTVGNRYTDLLVTDGYYYPEGWETSGHGGGDWLCVLHVDWEQGTIRWSPLCPHGSNWDSQDSHPHPVFSHDDRSVYYTTNRDGVRAVYVVETEQS